jgi:lysophospholipase L1-like esterase
MAPAAGQLYAWLRHNFPLPKPLHGDNREFRKMNIVVYGDSMSWGIIPGTRVRLLFNKRWTGVLQSSLGKEYRVIEECLNGRTTQYEDADRPARNGLEHVQMIIESHSPIDLMIVMLGINDFQDIIGVTSTESAYGLKSIICKITNFSPEPTRKAPQVLAIIPPEIKNPMGLMADKFSGYEIGENSESEYIGALEGLNIHIIKASKYISLSKVDGIHLDETEHFTLGKAVAKKVSEIGSM